SICASPANFFTSTLFFVCTRCHATAAYAPTYSARNFHRITPGLLRCLWTKRDDFLLLKNIERYGDDWEKVACGLNGNLNELNGSGNGTLLNRSGSLLNGSTL